MDLEVPQQDKAAIYKSPTLTSLVTNSGLAITESEYYALEFLPFIKRFVALREEMKQINYENPTLEDSKTARRVRLAMVENRGLAKGSLGKKEKLKEGFNLRANYIQTLHNSIEKASKIEEPKLEEVEKFVQIQEQKRIEALKKSRLDELSQYLTNAELIDLGRMEEDAYQQLLTTSKIAHAAQQEALRKKQEEEEQAAEKAKKAAEEKRRIFEENEKARLKAEAEAAELKAQQAKIENKAKRAAKVAKKNEEALKEELNAKNEELAKVKQAQEEEEAKKIALQKASDAEKAKAFIESFTVLFKNRPKFGKPEAEAKAVRIQEMTKALLVDLLAALK